jgi:thiol-disulfide isomerase/thioredoxin
MKLALAVVVALAGCTKAEPKDGAREQPAAAAKAGEHTALSGGWVALDATAPIAPALASFTKDALAAGKKPFAYLHASWCGPCKAIDKTHATDAKMIDAFAGTAIAELDIDAADPKALASLAMSPNAIPVFYKLDANGKPTGDKIDGGAWGDNIPDNMAPPLKAFFAK